MGSQSTTSHTPNIISLAIIILAAVAVVNGQAECIAKNLPEFVPLPEGEKLVIDLQNYFEGSNLSFAIDPSPSWAELERQWQCESIGWPGGGGQVVASHWLQNQQLLVSLGQSITGKYSLTLTQVDSHTLSNISLPANISKCSDFILEKIDKNNFKLLVSCLDDKLRSSLILYATVRPFDPAFISWKYHLSPLFTFTPILSTQIFFKNRFLLRTFLSSSNSYIQLWSWEQQYRQILGVIDKTMLDLDTFDLRAVQLSQDLLMLLDFHFGLHILRILGSNKIQIVATIPEPFFETFTYHPQEGILLLAKKGKVVSAKINNLSKVTMAIGMSFNLFNYKSVKKATLVNDKLVVLDESLINIFTVKANQNAYRHYSLHPSLSATHFFIENIEGTSPRVLLVRSSNYQVEHLLCHLRSSFLRFSTPDSTQKILITGKSIVNGQISSCQQALTLQSNQPSRQLIYDNGYTADKQILFANLPGTGLISLSKYGLGKNMKYRVETDPTSKILYTVDIRKQKKVPCNIQNRNISRTSEFYFTKTWLNLLIVQVAEDYELRYFTCFLKDAPSCTYALEVPNMKPVEQAAYALQEQTSTYSISWEALLQQVDKDLNILVRRLIIQKEESLLQVTVYCTIKIQQFIKEYQNITQLQVSNGKLYVLMAYRKQLRIYDLIDRECPLASTINKDRFDKGQYFSPRQIHFDEKYANSREPVIFIQQWNELLAIRLIGSDYKPFIFSKNTLPQSANGTVLLSLPYVLYLSFAQNTFTVFRLDGIQKLFQLRIVKLDQGYRFPQQCPEKKNCYKLLGQHHLSLRVVNTQTNGYEIKVYSIEQLISAVQEYLALTVSGSGSVHTYFELQNQNHHTLMVLQLVPSSTSSILRCSAYDLYLSPSILFNFTQIRSTIESYSENITLYLSTINDSRTHHFQVSLTNLGEGISRGNRFPGRGTSIQPASLIQIDDSYWFWGSIYNYDFDCRNCKDRIIFQQKIISESKEELPFTSEQFFLLQNEQQLMATTGSYLVQMQYNYSVWPYEFTSDSGYQVKNIFPLSIGGADCVDSIILPQRFLIISLCKRIATSQEEQKYYLSLVSTVSSKSFIIAESQLSFSGEESPKFQFKNNILVVYSEDMALVMTIWDVQGSLQLIQLDQIDRQDIADRICSAELISNASSILAPLTQVLYTLAITQCSSQLYYTSFSIYLEQETIIDEDGRSVIFTVPSIHVSYDQNINLLNIWSQKGIQIPSDARIVQTITRQLVSPVETDQLLTLLVLFDRFHSYDFRLTLSKQNKVIKTVVLDSVYYKFGSNIATSAQLQQYLVIKYILDVGFGKLGQLYGCYDLNNYVVGSDLIKQHHHFSTYLFKNFKEGSQTQQDFPWHLDGHRIFQLHHQHLQILSVSSKLRATILGLDDENSPPLYTQKIIISANNPTSARSATIVLQSVDEFILTDFVLALIIIGSLVLICVLVVVGRIGVRKLRKRMKLVPLASTSDVQEAELGWEERERSGEWRVNLTERSSADPNHDDIQ